MVSFASTLHRANLALLVATLVTAAPISADESPVRAKLPPVVLVREQFRSQHKLALVARDAHEAARRRLRDINAKVAGPPAVNASTPPDAKPADPKPTDVKPADAERRDLLTQRAWLPPAVIRAPSKWPSAIVPPVDRPPDGALYQLRVEVVELTRGILRPVPNAQISIQSLYLVTSQNADTSGQATFQLRHGRYQIRVMATGFRGAMQEVHLNQKVLTVRVELTRAES